MMLYKDNWEQTRQRFNEFWERENHDRPLLCLTGARDKKAPCSVKRPASIEQRWLDADYIVAFERARFESTYFAAESFPSINPNLGPDIFGATYGCGIVFQDTTSFAIPVVQDWEQHPTLQFDEHGIWWNRILELTKSIAKMSNGDYITGITDLHPGLDGLVSLRGPENLCMDLYDCPDQVKARTFELLDGLKVQLRTLGSLLPVSDGYTNWMNVWKQDEWYVTSCDFCGMISEEMFEEFVLPELQAELAFLNGKSIFHLDGPGALKHLDRLLEIPNLAGLQWVYGAGQPTAANWIDVYKKIQAANKLIHTYVVPSDIDILLDQLKPEGLMLSVDADLSEEEAKALESKVIEIGRKGRLG